MRRARLGLIESGSRSGWKPKTVWVENGYVTAMRVLKLLLVVSAFSGCEWLDQFTTVKVDNPVVGPAPPRMAGIETDPDATLSLSARLTADARSVGKEEFPGEDVNPFQRETFSGDEADVARDVQPAKFSSVDDLQPDDFSDSHWAAYVDRDLILIGDVLEPYSAKLAAVRKKISPEEYRRAREAIIKRDLKGHIESKLIVSALRRTLKKEQLEQLEKHLKKNFEKVVESRMKEMDVVSMHELDLKLQKEDGITLASLRTSFINRNMASAYIEAKSKKENIRTSRADLLAYYKEHLSDYMVPGQVKWQRIMVEFKKHGGKRGAFEVFEKAVEELKTGGGNNFGEVARRYSDGPKAKAMGQWGWISLGTLADSKLENTLFEMPVNVISQPIETDTAFVLMIINARKQPSRILFEEVQHKIKKKIEAELRRQAIKDVVAALYKNAKIETIFDGELPNSKKLSDSKKLSGAKELSGEPSPFER